MSEINSRSSDGDNSSASEEWFAKALTHNKANQNTEAIAYFEKAAENGHVEAMYHLGKKYRYIKDHQDIAKSLFWYEAAAENGHIMAMKDLAFIYSFGERGVNRDKQKAFCWYEKAAMAGDSACMYIVGDYYKKGKGVAQNMAAAFEWYKKSSEHGDFDAMLALGEMYQNGLGTEQDFVQARIWYEKAREGSLKKTKGALERHIVVEADQDASDTMCNQGLALYDDKKYKAALPLLLSEANKGNISVINKIGNIYYNGYDIAQDYTIAMQWYKKAAENGSDGAMNRIGYMYEVGEGVAQDKREALYWFEKAAEKGNANAMVNIAYMYDEGVCVTADKSEALKWYKKAADKGNTQAMVYIADRYMQSDDMTQDKAKAAYWYEKAAENGDVNALQKVRLMYAKGETKPPNGWLFTIRYGKPKYNELPEVCEILTNGNFRFDSFLNRFPALKKVGEETTTVNLHAFEKFYDRSNRLNSGSWHYLLCAIDKEGNEHSFHWGFQRSDFEELKRKIAELTQKPIINSTTEKHRNMNEDDDSWAKSIVAEWTGANNQKSKQEQKKELEWEKISVALDASFEADRINALNIDEETKAKLLGVEAGYTAAKLSEINKKKKNL